MTNSSVLYACVHKFISNRKLAAGRRDGSLPWVRPDSKSQVRKDHKRNATM